MNIQKKIDQVKTKILKNLNKYFYTTKDAGTKKGVLETKSDQIFKAHQKLEKIVLPAANNLEKLVNYY